MEPDTSQTWQHALDAKLVQRLWRRAEQPGLSQPRQAQLLLARHQSMAISIPFAQQFQRSASVIAEESLSQVPIVYAQPQPTVAGDTIEVYRMNAGEPADRAVPTVAGDTVEVHPMNAGEPAERSVAIVPARVASPQSSALHLNYTLLQHTSLTGSDGSSSQTMAAQRSVAPTTPATPAPKSPTLMPLEHAAQDGHLLHSRVALEKLPVVMSARAADSTSAITQLPLVRSMPLPLRSDSTPRVIAQDTLRSWPIVHVQSNGRGDRTSPATLPWSPRLGTDNVNTPVVLVVHEQITREHGTSMNLPVTPSPAPLPLAAMTAPAPQPATGQFVTGELQLAPRHGGVNAAQPTTTASAADIVATKKPAQNDIDIDRIVDRVHRKFIQQLAVEGERRGRR